jgi:hypothetical protein
MAATIQFIRALCKNAESFWENLRKWIADVVDVLSGG